MTETFTLPNLLAVWPFQPVRNHRYDPVAGASLDRQWLEAFKAFDPKAEETYGRSEFFLHAALFFPNVDAAHLRDAAHLTNCFFMIDDILESLDSASAREYATYMMDIFRDPSKPRDIQKPLGDMAARFWSQCLEYADPSSAKRILGAMASYFEAACQEAELRNTQDHQRMQSIDEYIQLRRGTVAMDIFYHFTVISKNLPDIAVNHPLVENLRIIATDLMWLSNDIISFGRERSLGLDKCNIVSLVMGEKELDLQGAVDFVAEWFQHEVKKFLEGMKHVPSFGEAIDPVLAEYISGFADELTGAIEWTFVTNRYHGLEGSKVRENGVLEVIPAKSAELSPVAVQS